MRREQAEEREKLLTWAKELEEKAKFIKEAHKVLGAEKDVKRVGVAEEVSMSPPPNLPRTKSLLRLQPRQSTPQLGPSSTPSTPATTPSGAPKSTPRQPWHKQVEEDVAAAGVAAFSSPAFFARRPSQGGSAGGGSS